VRMDQRKWQVEVDGWPLYCTRTFLLWLDFLPESLDLGERITTAEAWPVWRQQALTGTLNNLRAKLGHMSTVVRYPADGMAFVCAPILHPDLDEPAAMSEPTRLYAKVVTLLLEADAWRVHVVGPMIPPAELGKTAYSW
jgi:hypothetical protein